MTLKMSHLPLKQQERIAKFNLEMMLLGYSVTEETIFSHAGYTYSKADKPSRCVYFSPISNVFYITSVNFHSLNSLSKKVPHLEGVAEKIHNATIFGNKS